MPIAPRPSPLRDLLRVVDRRDGATLDEAASVLGLRPEGLAFAWRRAVRDGYLAAVAGEVHYVTPLAWIILAAPADRSPEAAAVTVAAPVPVAALAG
jgi:hypothetical protein